MNTKPIRVVEGSAKPYEAFWQVRDAAQTGGDPEIDFFGFISEYSWMGDEVTPLKFKNDLYTAGKGGPITIKMHSGGGEIFAASAIRAMLLEYPGIVTVDILGLCASAAVGIALAGANVRIYDTAYMMVHNPSFNMLMGSLDADMLRKFSDQLDMFKEGLLNAYENKTSIGRDKLSAMLDAETWLSAQQAVDIGFADEVISGGAPLKVDTQMTSILNYVNIPPVFLAVNAIPNSGQASASPADEAAQARRKIYQSQLENATNKIFNEANMNEKLRELMSKRGELVARANTLLEASEAEGREMNEAEVEEFEAILGNGDHTGSVGALDAQIARVEDQRARLKAALEKTPAQQAEKPEPTVPSAMSRAEFSALSAYAQASYIRGGGKLQD